MTARAPSTRRRVLAIAAAAAGMALLVLALGLVVTARTHGRAVTDAPAVAQRGPPIPSEADVFRTVPAALAVPPGAARRTGAHRRTLALYRTLRAYPGAPPRVPHGLTADEFRTGACGTCHERGGYVARFGAYAPVTPHPDAGGCLQCHVPEDIVVGTPLPGPRADDRCMQCHVPDGRTPPFRSLDWRASAWPATGHAALPGAPPPIPHPLEMRTNCVACHAGAAAVEEIRTAHPERANCRQCHVNADDATADFVRTRDTSDTPGGAR